MKHRLLPWLLGLLALVVVLAVAQRRVRPTPEVPARSITPAISIPDDNFRHLFATLSPQGDEAAAACAWLDGHWQPALVAPLLELRPFASRREEAERIARLIELHTGISPLPDSAPAWQWLWRTNAATLSGYAEFKGDLYSGIDSRFREYFATGRPATIRLDEIRWGGVRRDGIPPLRNPKMLQADEAAYLADSNVVFGVEFNRDARAYPKRILAWHEMVTDTIGGEDVCLVYCTLCGSAIPYRATVASVHHEMGTSGFLYRSNKLMYDAATKSLWNTLTGEPVVGPLVGRGIRLEVLPVVTTTWGEWRRHHPGTTVLSLETGHRRDYDEGVAYADYFATDDLMFPVPELDPALKNKDEILTVRIPGVTNACGGSVRNTSTRPSICTITLSGPYASSPAPDRSRSATSFCTVKASRSRPSISKSITSGDAMLYGRFATNFCGRPAAVRSAATNSSLSACFPASASPSIRRNFG